MKKACAVAGFARNLCLFSEAHDVVTAIDINRLAGYTAQIRCEKERAPNLCLLHIAM